MRAKNDEGGSPWASGSAITQGGTSGGGAVIRNIAENSAAGTNVGAAVTATANPNNYTLTHTLSGTDAGKFTIESSSGQIKVKTGTNLDYETKKVVQRNRDGQGRRIRGRNPELYPRAQQPRRLRGAGGHQSDRRCRAAGPSPPRRR